MGKVPIGRTIGETLGFTFGRYPAVLGVVWLPALIFGVCYVLVIVPMLRDIAMLARDAAHHVKGPAFAHDPFLFNRFMPSLQVLALIVSSWIGIGVTKAALGRRRTFPFAYVAIGMDELRLVAAKIVIIALIYGGILAIVLVALAIGGVGAAAIWGGGFDIHQFASLKPWAIGAAVAAGAALVCALVYFQVRLGFFIAPVTVVERRFGVWRSWELTRGNFWRILAVIVVVAVMALVLEIVLVVAVGVPAAFAVFGGIHAAGAKDPAAVFRALHPYLPVFGAVLLAILPLFYGLFLSPSAFAYRALMPEKPDGSEPMHAG